jgi:hypothetical protein
MEKGQGVWDSPERPDRPLCHLSAGGESLAAAAFDRLVNGLIDARGRAKPCALDSDDWLPLHHFYDQAQQLSEKIWVGNSCET